jgi:hypothetical protein
MLPLQAGREASSGVGAFFYERHRPEQSLLYQIIEQHYPDFLSAMEVQDRPLPGYVQDEFEALLQCGRLEHGFLRVRCSTSGMPDHCYRAPVTTRLHPCSRTASPSDPNKAARYSPCRACRR